MSFGEFTTGADIRYSFLWSHGFRATRPNGVTG
jgi:hypothetical protein